MATYVKIRIRRDYEENWKTANPLLLLGEIGCDMTNHKLKVGNGVDRWNNLEYIVGGEAGSIIIPTEPNPNPKPGDMYYDTVINSIRFWNGTAWLPIGIVISATAPTNPSEGIVWYSTISKKLQYWNGTKWSTVGGIQISPNAPASPSEGDLYYNSTNKLMYYWNGNQWVPIGALSENDIINILKNYPFVTVVDSGKPNNPYNGMVIYVVNEKKMYIYRNNAWLEMSSAASPATGTIVVVQSGKPSNPTAGMAAYVIDDKKMYVYHNNNWIEMTVGTQPGSNDGTLIVSDTRNAAPNGKAGDMLYAKDTKSFYYWGNNTWNLMTIQSTGGIDPGPIIEEVINQVLQQLDTHITNALKARNLFGLSYDIIQREAGGKPKVIKFEDNVRCMIYYGASNSTADYSKYVYRVVADSKYQVDFKYKSADTGGDKDVTWGSNGMPNFPPTFYVGRKVTKLTDAQYAALNIQWPAN